ncbi:hypothetical protein AIGOOFII_3138 [Methylobacterium marchantiae]|nr:hypothetical protein AIGOOFII_3138 [Methylobacterium marchantiae]
MDVALVGSTLEGVTSYAVNGILLCCVPNDALEGSRLGLLDPAYAPIMVGMDVALRLAEQGGSVESVETNPSRL